MQEHIISYIPEHVNMTGEHAYLPEENLYMPVDNGYMHWCIAEDYKKMLKKISELKYVFHG